MDYKEADNQLQGRCKSSRKLANNTYLIRRETMGGIAVRLHNTDILTFYPSGKIALGNGGFPTCTTHDRMNRYLPHGYHVSGEPVENRRSNGGMPVLRHNGQEVTMDSCAWIMPNGKLQGGDILAYRSERKREQNEARRPINHARYWIRKARGIFVDRANCKTDNRWNCDSHGRWNRRRNLELAIGQNENTLKCGCRVYRKQSVCKNLTVESILAEENVSVRLAKMQCYGMEKFFIDANPKILEENAGYQLIEVPLDRWQNARALKMTCPSTGAVYINMVPPNITTVSEGLDYMFDTTDYLKTVTQQA